MEEPAKLNPALDPALYEDWDDEYANAPYIPGGNDYPDRWASDAASFRRLQGGRAVLEVAYGEHPRESYDLFMPEDRPTGLVVFVHGGYWMKFDKSYWSHLAAGPVTNGWAVAMPGYVLAPEASIAGIGRQVAAAIEAVADRVDGPLALTGHSAGGQLVTRIISDGGLLSQSVLQRVSTVASISGVHDLRPLMLTEMNEVLRLSVDDARRESPALLEPVEGPQVSCWVGGLERPEFVRQSELLATAWSSRDRQINLYLEPDRHHFDIIDLLADPSSELVAGLTGDHG